MWVLFRRFKVREHERGLLFKDREFKARPASRAATSSGISLRKVRVDVVSVRDVWLDHKDLDVIAKSGALGDEARVVDLKDHERAVVWVDGRIEAVLKPGLYALWTVFHDVRVEVFDARAVRFEHADLAVIAAGARRRAAAGGGRRSRPATPASSSRTAATRPRWPRAPTPSGRAWPRPASWTSTCASRSWTWPARRS